MDISMSEQGPIRTLGGAKAPLSPEEAIAGDSFTLLDAGLLGTVVGTPYSEEVLPPRDPRRPDRFLPYDDEPEPPPRQRQAPLEPYLPGQDVDLPVIAGGSITMAVPSFVWTFAGTLATDQNGNFPTIVAETDGSFQAFDGQVNTAPTGQAVTLTFLKNGLSAATVTIAAGQTYGKSSMPVTYVAGDAWTIQVTQVGSTVPGTTLTARARARS